MFYFLLGFIFGCITGYFSNKQIHVDITYNGNEEETDNEEGRKKE